METIYQRIAGELDVAEKKVQAAVALLDDGDTVPFISRYRKEATGGLDDTQLRQLEERLAYLRELEERRSVVLNSIDEQGKLTAELKRSIQAADTKTRLEDLYLPYKPKRRTKGQIAIAAGIEPLADALYENPQLDPEQEAKGYVTGETETGVETQDAVFPNTKAVLDGAKCILMERFAEDADLLTKLRTYLTDNARLAAQVVEGKQTEGAKFRDYFDYSEALGKVPSHRALALFRGRKEGILQLSLKAGSEVAGEKQQADVAHPCEAMIARHVGIEAGVDVGENTRQRPADAWLQEVVRWTWRIKLQLHFESELLSQLRSRAEAAAIEVFAQNLKDLLLAAPAGRRATLGLDPGLRTGVKIAVVDNTGRLVDTATIYPHAPRNQWQESLAQLAGLVAKHKVELLAIGNGTASRETDKLCADLVAAKPELKLQKVMVSEAGASVYSASEAAALEFPDLDVTLRGAASIARRLQDPLAELVKIDAKAIGVGQYQHDVSQFQLAKSLDAVVEDCVNGVGVEVNTASAALLQRVAGLNQSIAENIVALRDQQGAFTNREALRQVPRLGDKTFQQAAGFLRIRGGENPLDASAVHPESYEVVSKIAEHQGKPTDALMGSTELLRRLNPADYTDERFGLPTVTDIIAELEKPGRDPRPVFKAATFKEGVEKLADVKPGMLLEGTVTNVTHFGAFVDVGVHQDGLVHISALADRFVKDPRDVVKTGDIVRVKVLEVDQQRKRIGLTMRLDDSVGDSSGNSSGNGSGGESKRAEHSQRRGKQDGSRAGKSGAAAKSKGAANTKRVAKTANQPLTGALAQALARAVDQQGK